MAVFKTPDFSDRAAAARMAKDAALARLGAWPPHDAVLVAERQATQEWREARAHVIGKQKALWAAYRTAAQRGMVSEATAFEKPKSTEPDPKAARDARYAVREARNK